MDLRKTLLLALAAGALTHGPAAATDRPGLDAMIRRHAAANGVPETLVHRVIVRESGYNPRAANRGNLGLMQIRHATARGMGYRGSASGLLDAETNLTYAVPYLANAFRVAGGNPNRAVSLYASGYYYAAKRKGMLARLKGPATATALAEPPAASPAAGGIPFGAFASAAP